MNASIRVVQSDWINFATIRIESGVLAVADPLFCNDPSAAVQIFVPPADYLASVRVLAYPNDPRVSRLRVVRRGTQPHTGQHRGDVNVDFAQTTMYDFVMLDRTLQKTTLEQEEAFANAIDAVDLYGIATLWAADEVTLAVVRSGFGDGRYSVYELVEDGQCVGAEVIFIEEDEAYLFEGVQQYAVVTKSGKNIGDEPPSE